LALPVVGAEHAPELMAFLKQMNVDVLPAPDRPEEAVRSTQHDVVLRIGPEFPQRWREGKPAPLELILDETRQTGEPAVRRIRSLLYTYGNQIGSMRLIARGVDYNIGTALVVEELDLSTAQSKAASMLTMMPYFIIAALILGGMYVATDVVAGERERQSLEQLFLNPVPRWVFVLGKLAAVVLFAAVTLAGTLIGFVILARLLPSTELGINLRLDGLTVLRIVVVVLPLLVFVATLELMISAFSKSFRAAQASLSLVSLFPMVPGVILMMRQTPPKPWMRVMPMVSEQVLIVKMLRGEPTPLPEVAMAMAATALGALILYFVTLRAFSDERLLFGRS
jgi:sodium transport system permease protein